MVGYAGLGGLAPEVRGCGGRSLFVELSWWGRGGLVCLGLPLTPGDLSDSDASASPLQRLSTCSPLVVVLHVVALVPLNPL